MTLRKLLLITLIESATGLKGQSVTVKDTPLTERLTITADGVIPENTK